MTGDHSPHRGYDNCDECKGLRFDLKEERRLRRLERREWAIGVASCIGLTFVFTTFLLGSVRDDRELAMEKDHEGEVAAQKKRIDALLEVVSKQDACASEIAKLREPPGC